jgi:hypothetical protein
MTVDEAKAIIDRFLAADSSPAAMAAVAKFLIDKIGADGTSGFERRVVGQRVMDGALR